MGMEVEKKKPLLLIGIFFWETMNGEFFARCLGIINQLFQMSQRVQGGVAFKVSICAHKTRVQAKTELIDEALRMDADWVMFLDGKLDVGSDIVEEMMKIDEDIVNINHVFTDKGKILRKTSLMSGELLSCGLIKTSVFKKVHTPYFASSERDGHWFNENEFFVDHAKKNGYKVRNMEYSKSCVVGDKIISQVIVQKAERIKTLIAVPVAETVNMQFVRQFLEILHSLLNRSIQDKNFSFGVHVVYGQEIVRARTEMVEEARRLHAKQILWLDSDSIVSVDDVYRMIGKSEDIVSGITVQKSAPYLPVVLKKEDGYLNMQVDIAIGTGNIEVDAVGMGLTLTKMAVFEKMSKPYFKITRHELPDGSIEYEGEDVYMSEKSKGVGFKLWVDTNICYGHLGKVATIQDYILFSKEKLVYLKECREKALSAMCDFLDGKYDTHQLKMEMMKMKKKIKEVEESLLSGEEWLLERADWHLWGEQWERDQNMVWQVMNMCRKYGSLKVLCLDRGIGQLPTMLMQAGIDVDCLDIVEANIPEHQSEMIKNLWLQKKINIVSLKQLTKNYYDVILIIDWFEHLDDDKFDICVKGLQEILKAGCELIVACAPHNDRHRHYQWTEDRKRTILEIKRMV